MTTESRRRSGGLIAKGAKLRPEPSLSTRRRFPSARGARGNYGKYPSIRIDIVTKRAGADRLTISAKPLKNNVAFFVTSVSRRFRSGAEDVRRQRDGLGLSGLGWGVPQGLRGLSRVGA